MEQPKIRLPENGMGEREILERLHEMRGGDADWQAGRTFSLVYYPGDGYSGTIKKAYKLFFSENALNPTAFPSLRRMEAETVGITAGLLNGTAETAGTITSGGTESILMAVKTARSWARKERPHITQPEIVLPASAHPAFHKACHYFNIKPVVVPTAPDGRADVEAMRLAISGNTAMLVGSAPSYPHGLIDPIEALSDLALERGLLLHVDACVGGYILPFLRMLGRPLPPFDFALPGVTSMSADIHKYGYAAKGASLILYKNRQLRKHQFYVYSDWTGGIYASPAMGGTRPGGAIAAAWTALNCIGKDGYLMMARKTLNAFDTITKGIEGIPELHIIGQPDATLLAFGSDTLDIYAVGDELSIIGGWNADRQQAPPCLHLTVSQIHEKVADEFVADLRLAVEKAKKLSFHKVAASVQVGAVKGLKKLLPDGAFAKVQELASKTGGSPGGKRTAAMYGMLGALKGSGELDELVLDYLDKLNSLD